MLESASRGGGSGARGVGLVPGGWVWCQGWSGARGGLVPGGFWSWGGLVPGGIWCRGVWSGGSGPGGIFQHALRQTPPVDRQTPVKILPWPNFVAAGNKHKGFIHSLRLR